MSGSASLTIPDLFDAAVGEAADRMWLTFEEDSFTYEEAAERIDAIAGALREHGAARGTTVLATMRNTPGYLFTWLGLMRLGATLLPLNPGSKREEMAGLAQQVMPPVAVTDADLRDAVVAGVPDAKVLSATELMEAPPAERVSATRPDDVAVLIPTSGTTGRSKLVMQTQRAYAMAGEGFPFWLGLNGDDRLMTSLPLFHINAPAYSVLGSVGARAGLILLPRFSASTFLEEARLYGATEFNAIGAMLEILMRQPERPDDADTPLRLCYTGPSPSRERQLEIEERFGLEIVCGYALSESPYGLIWRRGTRPYGTLGSARQHPAMGTINHVRVMDEGEPVAVEGTGELELNNPAVMLGYHDMPDETAAALGGGWLKTGDIVRVNDDETFTFVGRRKELIRRRGENLSPVEVEMTLEQHPAIAEAAVVGVPSELSDEDVKAFVVFAEGHMPPLADVREFVAGRLARFKVPRYLEAVSELPHTPTGRVAKHELPRVRTEKEEDFEPTHGGEQDR